ncbi:hypothetical protein C6I20_09445 [Aeromicrobium sp. A1-2]|nr:hypothetical protein C6I20_09445 [Aeromicrobium sp. A1-2]
MLVTFGGHPGMSASRPMTGSTHAGVLVKPGRLPPSVTANQHAHVLPHLDLAATLQVVTPHVPQVGTVTAPGAVVTRPGRDLVVATGRAPPAA